eukprot:scaffold465606_cov25-Prasinocladus_malaysianus.AAC.1
MLSRYSCQQAAYNTLFPGILSPPTAVRMPSSAEQPANGEPPEYDNRRSDKRPRMVEAETRAENAGHSMNPETS